MAVTPGSPAKIHMATGTDQATQVIVHFFVNFFAHFSVLSLNFDFFGASRL